MAKARKVKSVVKKEKSTRDQYVAVAVVIALLVGVLIGIMVVNQPATTGSEAAGLRNYKTEDGAAEPDRNCNEICGNCLFHFPCCVNCSLGAYR